MFCGLKKIVYADTTQSALKLIYTQMWENLSNLCEIRTDIFLSKIEAGWRQPRLLNLFYVSSTCQVLCRTWKKIQTRWESSFLAPIIWLNYGNFFSLTRSNCSSQFCTRCRNMFQLLTFRIHTTRITHFVSNYWVLSFGKKLKPHIFEKFLVIWGF